MTSLWVATHLAEEFLEKGERESALFWIEWAEMILKNYDPRKEEDPPAICCVHFVGKDIIHCGKTREEPLFPGTVEERKVLCKRCRDFCRKRIEVMKKKLGL